MKKVTLVMLALTAVMQLPAQEQGRTLSLEEALEMTLSDNPAIRAAEFNRRAAQQERRAAIGLRMPQIGITGSYAYLGKDIEIDLNNMKTPVQNLAGQILQSGMIPSDYIPSISQMLSGAMAASWALPLQDRSLGFVGGDVTVPLWMGGKINAANRAARINEQTARSQGIQQRNALVSELVERYYGLALARQVVVVRQQVVDGVRKHLEDAAALEAQGMISRSEKLYVEFKMSEAERDLQNAQSQVETIAAALNSTIGQTDDYQPVTAMFILERIEPLDHFRTLAAERNPLLDQVDQTTRRGDQDIAAVLECRGLRLVAHAAHDGHGNVARDVGDFACDLVDLLGKLARGGDDEHHGATAVALGLFSTAATVAAAALAHGLGRSDVLQIVHSRQQKGGRLAGAGLSGGKQVTALEHHGDRAGLHGRRRRVAQVLDSTKHLVGEAQLVKGGQALGSGLDGLGSIGLIGGIEGSLGHGLAGLVQNLGVGDVRYRITHMLLFLICTRNGHGMRPRGRAW